MAARVAVAAAAVAARVVVAAAAVLAPQWAPHWAAVARAFPAGGSGSAPS